MRKLRLVRCAVFDVRPRTAARVAYLAAALNLGAAAAMVLLLKPGLPGGGTLAQRAAYTTSHPAAWTSGWMVWNAAAVALLAFYVALAGRWMGRAPMRCALATLLAAAGLAVDLSAEVVAMAVAPKLSPHEFGIAGDVVALLTGYVANGLYTLAGLLLTSAGIGELPPRLVLLSVPVWLSGIALSVASVMSSRVGQWVSVAILMPSFAVWSARVGRWLQATLSQGERG